MCNELTNKQRQGKGQEENEILGTIAQHEFLTISSYNPFALLLSTIASYGARVNTKLVAFQSFEEFETLDLKGMS